MTWVNDLDACASLGILNFDGPAYVMGTQPRYYGNPNFETVPDMVMPMYPPSDVYQGKNPIKSMKPNWKKIATGIIVAALAVFGFKKLGGAKLFKNIGARLSKLYKSAGKKFKKIKLPKFKSGKMKNWFSNLGSKIKGTKIFKNIRKFFKKTP